MKKTYTRKQIAEAIAYWKEQLAKGNYRKVNESVPLGEYSADVKYLAQELLAAMGDIYMPESENLAEIRDETTGDYRIAENACARLCSELLNLPEFQAKKRDMEQISDLYYRIGAMLEYINEKNPAELDEIINYAFGHDNDKFNRAYAFVNNDLDDTDYVD